MITPFESKNMDLIPDNSYKNYRPEDVCIDYQYHVLSAIELLDVNNATCKDQYRDLRTGEDDRTMFFFILNLSLSRMRCRVISRREEIEVKNSLAQM